ncbi:hypothetical protein GQX74_007786 [Glossina fuscipes]|nr:hypothetical protein GQX74_007786 [Glossina fuscipes]
MTTPPFIAASEAVGAERMSWKSPARPERENYKKETLHLGVRRNGFHDVDETLPKRAFVEVLQRNLGLVVVPVGLDEPEETPDELAADNVDMEPFDDSGFRKKIKKGTVTARQLLTIACYCAMTVTICCRSAGGKGFVRDIMITDRAFLQAYTTWCSPVATSRKYSNRAKTFKRIFYLLYQPSTCTSMTSYISSISFSVKSTISDEQKKILSGCVDDVDVDVNVDVDVDVAIAIAIVALYGWLHASHSMTIDR